MGVVAKDLLGRALIAHRPGSTAPGDLIETTGEDRLGIGPGRPLAAQPLQTLLQSQDHGIGLAFTGEGRNLRRQPVGLWIADVQCHGQAV